MPKHTQSVQVTGDENFILTAGGNITYTENQFSIRDRRKLVSLLHHLRNTWITNVLEHSLHEATLLDLGLRTEPEAVTNPWTRYLEVVGEPGRMLPPDKTIGEVFAETNRMLLILGEPGSGKTTTLLTLARECIDQAERDSAAPVPVVLNLSSWADLHRPINEWLVSEIAQYNVGKRAVHRWLKQCQLLLFLDGLDEVKSEWRTACVEALHAFVREYGVAGMVICCRVNEYRELAVRLQLGGAVFLAPLGQDQINAYVNAAGPKLEGLRVTLANNAILRDLAASPLMLSIMSRAFCDAPVEALKFDDISDPSDLRDRIFIKFVDRMFVRRERTCASMTLPAWAKTGGWIPHT